MRVIKVNKDKPIIAKKGSIMTPKRFCLIDHDAQRETQSWTTLAGKKYLVKDISDSHLANIIEYLIERDKSSDMIKFFKLEQAYRENNGEHVKEYSVNSLDTNRDLSEFYKFGKS